MSDSFSYFERRLIKQIRSLGCDDRERFMIFATAWTKACKGSSDVTEQQQPKLQLVKTQ